jgi:hypothetical protein
MNELRFCFAGSGLNVWLSWEETETHYVLRHASGFQFLNIPKGALRLSSTGWALRGDVRWNASERLFEWAVSNGSNSGGLSGS